jgi:hypothetical protein
MPGRVVRSADEAEPAGEGAHRGDRAEREPRQIAERRSRGRQGQRRQDAEEVRAAGDAVQHADGGGGADVQV